MKHFLCLLFIFGSPVGLAELSCTQTGPNVTKYTTVFLKGPEMQKIYRGLPSSSASLTDDKKTVHRFGEDYSCSFGPPQDYSCRFTFENVNPKKGDFKVMKEEAGDFQNQQPCKVLSYDKDNAIFEIEANDHKMKFEMNSLGLVNIDKPAAPRAAGPATGTGSGTAPGG